MLLLPEGQTGDACQHTSNAISEIGEHW